MLCLLHFHHHHQLFNSVRNRNLLSVRVELNRFKICFMYSAVRLKWSSKNIVLQFPLRWNVDARDAQRSGCWDWCISEREVAEAWQLGRAAQWMINAVKDCKHKRAIMPWCNDAAGTCTSLVLWQLGNCSSDTEATRVDWKGSGGATPGRVRSNDLAGRSTALPSPVLLCFGNNVNRK